MKICPNCGAEVEDHFELCWKCNYSFAEGKTAEIQDERETDIICLRCETPMYYEGNYNVRVGIMPEGWKNLDLYACPECGKVEFFIPEQELRKRKELWKTLIPNNHES